MAWLAGAPKLMQYNERSATYPDWLGLGSEVSMAAAVFFELACGALVTVGALTRFTNPPADLSLLVSDLSSDAAAEERARQRAEEARAKAPLVCFDGRVDPACVCGSDWNQCCVYHGGASHCLPPPP